MLGRRPIPNVRRCSQGYTTAVRSMVPDPFSSSFQNVSNVSFEDLLSPLLSVPQPTSWSKESDISAVRLKVSAAISSQLWPPFIALTENSLDSSPELSREKLSGLTSTNIPDPTTVQHLSLYDHPRRSSVRIFPLGVVANIYQGINSTPSAGNDPVLEGQGQPHPSSFALLLAGSDSLNDLHQCDSLHFPTRWPPPRTVHHRLKLYQLCCRRAYEIVLRQNLFRRLKGQRRHPGEALVISEQPARLSVVPLRDHRLILAPHCLNKMQSRPLLTKRLASAIRMHGKNAC
ncbi:hypothetical protein BJ742DRAFT_84944 [Cladochytrium replicatum]|nr:hypothetical protein BJ742DRAFT_84944 [Cladochytrium replicatum]